jgi:hypothetical protein
VKTTRRQPPKNLTRLRGLTTENAPPVGQRALDRRGQVVGREGRRRCLQGRELSLGATPLDLETLDLRDEGRDRPAVPHRFSSGRLLSVAGSVRGVRARRRHPRRAEETSTG